MVRREYSGIKMVRFILLIFTLLTYSCTSPKEVVVYKEVKVPIHVPIDYPLREVPELPIFRLTDRSSADEVLLSYFNSVGILMDEVRWYRGLMYPNKDSIVDKVNGDIDETLSDKSRLFRTQDKD